MTLGFGMLVATLSVAFCAVVMTYKRKVEHAQEMAETCSAKKIGERTR